MNFEGCLGVTQGVKLRTAALLLAGLAAACSSPALTTGALPLLEPVLLTEGTDSFVFLATDSTLTVIDLDAASTATHEIPELAPGDPLHRIVSRGSLLAFYGQTETEPAVFTLDPSRPQEPMMVAEA